jgi:hypothetical protein
MATDHYRGCFWRSIRMRTKPLLPLVPRTLQLTDEQFAEVLSTCDPSTARLGEAFFDPDMNSHFETEMLLLLQDARRAWM